MPQQPQPQQQPMAAPAAEPKALARRPSYAPAQQQQVFIEMSQVLNKTVITRTTGRNLGTVSALWVDPVRYEVVSLDLDDKKGMQSTRVGVKSGTKHALATLCYI